MKEYKVGEVFKFENDWYIVVNELSCSLCAFNVISWQAFSACGCPPAPCGWGVRKDNKNVIFQKVRI